MTHIQRLRIGSTIFLTLFQATVHAQNTESPPTPGEVAKALGFAVSEIRRIEVGDVISKPLKEGSDKELAGVVAVFFRKPLAEVVDFAMQKWLEADKDIRAFRSWKPADPADGVFADLALDADETSEAERFAHASRGDKLNLSASEISQFKNVRSTPQAVSVALRAVLKARYLAYSHDGLSAVTPVRAHRGASSPADELKSAIHETMTAAPRSNFFSALLTYPADQPADIEHSFYWFKQTVEDRPTFVLAHVSMRRSERAAIIAEQQFYVSHSYNSNFVAGGCLAVEGGTMVFYVNRTFTDQVAGFGAGAKHRIGRGQMISGVTAKLKRTRENLRE